MAIGEMNMLILNQRTLYSSGIIVICECTFIDLIGGADYLPRAGSEMQTLSAY